MRRNVVLVGLLLDRALNEPMNRVHKERERKEGIARMYVCMYVAVRRKRELISVPQFKKFFLRARWDRWHEIMA